MTNFAGVKFKSPFQAKRQDAATNLKKTVVDQTAGRAWTQLRVRDWDSQALKGPVAAYHTARTGVAIKLLLQLIYNRIHLTIRDLNLGNITTAQQAFIGVWNANFGTVQLTSIELEETAGITIGGQQVPPITFKALEEKQWTVSIPADGPAVVNATITFHFADGTSLPLHIYGNRITVWSLATDWSAGVLERLEWLTSIQTSPLGVEQRRALRIAPRRTFQVQAIARDLERQMFDISVQNWGGRSWAIPIWNCVQRINYPVTAGDTEIMCTTANLDFEAGGLAILRGKTAFDYEVVSVESIQTNKIILERPVQANWPSRTILYPARPARLAAQPNVSRLTDRSYIVQAQFQLVEASDYAAAMPTETYRGYPVFSLPPEESEELTSTWQRIIETLDNQTDLPFYLDTAGQGFSAVSHRWQAVGRAQQAVLRKFFYALKGRWKAVWLPTWSADITILTDSPNELVSALDIEFIAYSKYGLNTPGRRDIRIEMRDGTVISRRILSSALNEDGTERLGLDSAMPLFRRKNIKRASFMALMRLDQDYVEINHVTDSAGEANAKTVWRNVYDAS